MKISTGAGPVLLIQAVSLEFPDIPGGHINKMPFSGILTRIDEPSDSPPGGAGGKRVLLTRAAAEGALASLLGMGVDLTKDLDGHDAQKKIGIITSAHIDGSALRIAGFIYSADFPQEALRIHLNHADLGFSFEARNLGVESASADPLVVKSCTFTGAAILLKNEAAYKTTALAAAKAKEHEMEAEVLKAITASIEAALAPVSKTIAEVSASQTAMAAAQAVQAAAIEELRTSPPVAPAVAAAIAKVAPHVAAIEAAVAQMEKDGVGSAAQIAGLRRLATGWKQDANLGRMPADTDIAGYLAAAAPLVPLAAAPGVKVEDSPEFKAMKAAHDKEIADAKDATAALETKFKDLEGQFKGTRPPPERKSLDAGITAALARAGLTAPEDGQTLSLAKVDAAIAAMPGGMDLQQRMHLKTALAKAGVVSLNGAP